MNLQVAWPDEAVLDAVCASSEACLATGPQVNPATPVPTSAPTSPAPGSPTMAPTTTPAPGSPTKAPTPAPGSPTKAPTPAPTKESTASSRQAYAMLTTLLLVIVHDY
mmetsp:Transcript_5183/g.11448  ORF Transcript_5183/g.11448 Transcript_5183/m.11448 type:complete len:108 (-) Transcript_5183:105-428(-)|eukprot:CAMPEP_0203774404 /NCGR_PEP_ID=MMETSP0099_2-20121227/5311_1 /ASSEMBLY_ACC=CAM_ASM_000209 /TAXON_ID=96639 /ORGANISM=" , Strain NY0313808BC1" /LENGTH=107 /DNA_ID=CAMNT_0050672575 /DNA_START=264 /DNA_END=587 /DNA_ORIENTATION=-